MTFKTGDIFRLKSDRKKMTITRITGEVSDVFVLPLTDGYVETEWT